MNPSIRAKDNQSWRLPSMIVRKFFEQALRFLGIVCSQDRFVDLIKCIAGNLWIVSIVRYRRHLSQLFTFRTHIIWNALKVFNTLLSAVRSL